MIKEINHVYEIADDISSPDVFHVLDLGNGLDGFYIYTGVTITKYLGYGIYNNYAYNADGRQYEKSFVNTGIKIKESD